MTQSTATVIAANNTAITAQDIVAEAMTAISHKKRGYNALNAAIADGSLPAMSQKEKIAAVEARWQELKAAKAEARAKAVEEVAAAKGVELEKKAEAKAEKKPAPIAEEDFGKITELAKVGYVAEIARLVEAGIDNPIDEEKLTSPDEVFLAWNEEIDSEEPVLDLDWLAPHMKYRGAVVAAIKSGRWQAKEAYKAEQKKLAFQAWEKGAREVVKAALAENPNRDFEKAPAYHEGKKIFARYWRPAKAKAQAEAKARARGRSFIEGTAGADKNAGAPSGKTARKKAAMAARGETPESKKAAQKAADRARGLSQKGGQKKKK